MNEEQAGQENTTDCWKPVELGDVFKFEKAGDELIGVFKKTSTGKYGTNYTIEVEGKDVVVFGKTVLDTKLASIEPGTQVRIVYVGEKKSDTGRMYQDYEVYTKA